MRAAYRDRVPTSSPPPGAVPDPERERPHTLWEAGRSPAVQVVGVVAVLVALVTALEVLIDGRLGPAFDVGFVVLCVAAALAVRTSDFFVVGVLPPLLLAGVVVTLAALDRAAVARPDDGLVQSIVSGLAHRATALLTGYALTLGILALRQLALRHHGALRPGADPLAAGRQPGGLDAAPAAARRSATPRRS